ncbi:MAG: SIMPL domain-containing protein [candidate division Zixibacteria bacterium]|nr:SIMPL domain-containing protein [candidate division Zixibacteria bacterium]
MFKRLSVILVVCLICSMSINANDTTEKKPNTLTVSGKVKLFAKADRASIVFSVNGEGKSLEQAFNRIRDKMDSVTTKLVAIGLEEKELSTSFFHSGENYGNKAFLSSKRDYKTSMTTTITTSKLEILDKIVIALSKCGVETISEISFEIIDYEQIRLDVLKKATSKAKEKAELIAETLDIEFSGIISFREVKQATAKKRVNLYGYENRANPFNASYEMGGDYEQGTQGIFPEDIKIESEVKVVFEIKKNSEQVTTP